MAGDRIPGSEMPSPKPPGCPRGKSLLLRETSGWVANREVRLSRTLTTSGLPGSPRPWARCSRARLRAQSASSNSPTARLSRLNSGPWAATSGFPCFPRPVPFSNTFGASSPSTSEAPDRTSTYLSTIREADSSAGSGTRSGTFPTGRRALTQSWLANSGNRVAPEPWDGRTVRTGSRS